MRIEAEMQDLQQIIPQAPISDSSTHGVSKLNGIFFLLLLSSPRKQEPSSVVYPERSAIWIPAFVEMTRLAVNNKGRWYYFLILKTTPQPVVKRTLQPVPPPPPLVVPYR